MCYIVGVAVSMGVLYSGCGSEQMNGHYYSIEI